MICSSSAVLTLAISAPNEKHTHRLELKNYGVQVCTVHNSDVGRAGHGMLQKLVVTQHARTHSSMALSCFVSTLTKTWTIAHLLRTIVNIWMARKLTMATGWDRHYYKSESVGRKLRPGSKRPACLPLKTKKKASTNTNSKCDGEGSLETLELTGLKTYPEGDHLGQEISSGRKSPRPSQCAVLIPV